MKKLFRILFALIVICMMTVIVSAPFQNVLENQFSFMASVFSALLFLTFLMPFAKGILYAGLNREIWLAELQEGFFADDSWLSECRDLSMWVEYDKINLAEAGMAPNVLINNTTYPIAVTERADGALVLELDNFDTENQSLKFADRVELAYDKLKSFVFGHKQALRMTFMQKGAHAIAPAADSLFTPLLLTSGAASGGRKTMSFNDLIDMQLRFNNAEIPAEGRILLLNSTHHADLRKEDKAMYKDMLKDGTIYGFKLYAQADQRLPRYNKTTGAKVAFGAAAAPSTDTIASIAFHKDEVGRAVGTDNMFASEAKNDPIYRRDVIGFSRRGLVIPIRNKGVAAFYSPAA